MRSVVPFTCLAALLVHCAPVTQWEGPSPADIPATFIANVPYVSLALPNGGAHPVLLDTGTPLVMLDPRVFTFTQNSPSLTVFNGTLRNATLVSLTACETAPCAFDTLNGLLGGAALLSLRLTLDPRHAVVRINARDTTPNTRTARTVSFTPYGAGRYQFPEGVIDVPNTRVVLSGAIESLPRGRYLLDTGASFVVLRPDVFDALTHDGRATQTLSTQTALGTATARVARASSLALDGVDAAQGVLVMTDVPVDFDALARETGGPIDGLLGGTLLRLYAVTVDHPARTVTFARYSDDTHVRDEFVRVGVRLRVEASSVRIQSVIDGSSAARALSANERACLVNAVVVAIDGAPAQPGPLDTLDVRLRGRAGDTRNVEIRDACDGTAHTYTWALDALL